MRPYKASNDVTNGTWHGLYYWAGVWHTVCGADGAVIRFATWADARNAAKLEHAKTKPVTEDEHP